MSILYDDGQRAIATEARRVLDARADRESLLGLLERSGQFDTAFWDTVVEQGWAGIAIPEEHGGLGLGLIEAGLVAMACGAVTAGAPFLTAGYGAASVLVASGHNALQQKWLPAMATGQVRAAIAFAEGNSPLPDAPSATFSGGRLSGRKVGVAGGQHAEFAIVWALQDGSPVLLLVELGKATREPVYSFDNSRCHAHLVFDDTPADLLLEGDAARAAALQSLARMAVVTAHEQVGGAEALLSTSRDYALERKAFGQPIGAFQSIKHRLAEIYGLVEIGRANCIHAASRQGQDDFLEAAACARISATEAYDTAARDCVQIHGGIGVTWESGLHLHSRRARSLAIEQGNLFFWEDLLARQVTGVAR